jgi:ABC-2 type transport system permease protein
VKLLFVFMKDLRLILRDRTAAIGLLLVPIVVIVFVAESQSRGRDSGALLLPVVDEDQGPVANAFIKVLRDHAEVEVVDRQTAERIVGEEHRAAAMLVLPSGLSKRYLTERPSKIELNTDPAQWAGVQTVRVLLLLADREAASLADPFRQELIEVVEHSLTGPRLSFSSVEQNVPGFSVMFVLLSLVYGMAFGLHDEEAWGTSGRLAIAPVSQSSVLGGKLLARALIAFVQLSILLGFGHVVYGISLGREPVALVIVVLVIALSMASFSVIIAALARTREQILPVGLAAVFVLASLGGCFWPYGELPRWMQIAAHGAITTWSMFSLLDVMLRDRGLYEIAPNLLVLCAYGLVSFLIGARFFRYGERWS